MAKAKYGALISKISGSIGGTTFQNTNHGLIIKNKVNKNPIASVNSSNSSAYFQYLSSYWLNLTVAQQDLWKQWIKFKSQHQYANNYKLLQPREAFIKFNMYCLLFEKTLIIEPPFYYSLYNPVTIQIGTNTATLKILTSRLLNYNAEILILFLTRKVNETINNPGSRYRLMQCDLSNGFYIDFKTEYERQLGTIPESGDTIFAKWYLFGFTELALSYKYEQKIVIDSYA